jgi:hypothetical protein
MILTSYEVSNWGPHKNQKLEFPRGAKTIAICAENDQGKSWILRGIGFTLSIGRNEYGDQTSVHVGENESKHTLQFEQNGEIHTIEKIVRTKENEEEGTITFINGEKTDRAGFESFYNGLGLPHPSVWLPIVISMQNQTDYHLRSKKRDREEALRAACQLTRIDNWRDALSSKTNEEEKRLLSENASLNAKVETLSKTIAENEKTQNSIYNDIRSHSEFVLGTPNTTDPTDSDETAQKVIFIDELAPLLTLFREKESQSLREATALEGLKRGESLAELGVTRCKAELSNIPGSSAEQELAWEERRDTLQRETRSRRLSELIKKSTSVNKTLLAKETELLALGSKQNPEVLQSAKTQLRLCLHTAALLEGTNADVSALSTKLGCKTKEALSNIE